MTRVTKSVIFYFVLQIVVGIFLVPVIMPRFVISHGGSQLHSCINNLRVIDAGKEQWAMAAQKTDDDSVDIKGVNEYIKGNTTPVCPGGGKYFYDRIGQDPRCVIHGGLEEYQRWATDAAGAPRPRFLDTMKLAGILLIAAAPIMLFGLIPYKLITLVRAEKLPQYHVPGFLVLVLLLGIIFILVKLGQTDNPDDWRSPIYRCVHIMNWITAHKEDQALSQASQPGADPLYEKLVEGLKQDRFLKCPRGGTYAYGSLQEPIRCSIHGTADQPSSWDFTRYMLLGILAAGLVVLGSGVLLNLIGRMAAIFVGAPKPEDPLL